MMTDTVMKRKSMETLLRDADGAEPLPGWEWKRLGDICEVRYSASGSFQL
jgi:hypothetical protein